MTRSDDKRLGDIVATGTEVAEITGRGRATFDGDVVVRRALERCLEIIGEASKGLTEEVRSAIPGVPWSEVVRLRDRLSHHYHRVDPDELWATAERDVPRLLAALAVWRAGQPDR